MALLKINWHPTRKELGDFGKIALIATVLISLLLWGIKGLGLQWTLPISAVGLIIFVASKQQDF
jgi:ABC-type sulfate transport system permease component